MASEYRFPLPLEHGLHARPASVLQEKAAALPATLTLINNRNGAEANVKSVLSLVAADVRYNDPCTLIVDGDGEVESFATLKAFLTDVFPGCDEPLPVVEAADGGVIIPRILRNLGTLFHQGVAVSPGIATAPAVVLGAQPLPTGFPGTSATPNAELALFRTAVKQVSAEIGEHLSTGANATEAAVLRAHLGIVNDPEFHDRVEAGIRGSGLSAGAAISEAERHYAAVLGASESALLRERALDIRDVAGRLLRSAYPGAMAPAGAGLSAPGIVVAEDMTPSEFLGLDRTLLKGLVMSQGGATSHTVILARAFGIPAVTGVRDATKVLQTGLPILLDARRGLVIPEPAEPVRRYYALEASRDRRRAESLAALSGAECHTADGRRVQVAANVATHEEAGPAFANGAEGIGLYRTEMLFMDRDAPPDEKEQYAAYSAVVQAAQGKPVIIRTLDIGGDKPLPYLNLPKEENPFLGYRAVRFYEEHADLVKTQLRAILRAAAVGTVQMMVPMVSCVEEVRTVRGLLAAAQAELEATDATFGSVELGIMAEVPAVAFAMDQLSAEVDFFSIGTNDLTQYTLAVDRGNRKVAGLYSNLHPALLAMLKAIVDGAHRNGRWVGMCGEMAGVERFAPLLVGLGLDELSLGGPGVPAMKAAVAKCDSAECAALVATACGLATVADVEAALSDFAAAAGHGGIVDDALINLSSSAQSREEVIKQMVDRLYLAGRVSNPDTVEEAVWDREDMFATDLVDGFAIPHCKSPDVTANTIGVLRLVAPIKWKAESDTSVRVVLMLTIRKSEHADDEHMRIFARLSRKMMHEEFQERLMTEQDPAALARFIEETIQ